MAKFFKVGKVVDRTQLAKDAVDLVRTLISEIYTVDPLEDRKERKIDPAVKKELKDALDTFEGEFWADKSLCGLGRTSNVDLAKLQKIFSHHIANNPSFATRLTVKDYNADITDPELLISDQTVSLYRKPDSKGVRKLLDVSPVGAGADLVQ
jgi:hypothetical protein